MSTRTLILGLLVLIVGLGIVVYAAPFKFLSPEPVACTMEAKICPDGSSVGRTGPNCEFADCIDITIADYGVMYGTVTLSPTCPVETLPPDPSCAPRPYWTIVSIRTLSGVMVASVPTDENGYYRIKVKPGTYDVVASGGNPLPQCVSVRTNVVKLVSQDAMDPPTNISCDTGIR
ncbi:MAG: carboxypeptidase-like regulatory domain-containing protein [bacterium]|nr:carboxypeptidase-like regulatory domain-containing protein [bacterium]